MNFFDTITKKELIFQTSKHGVTALLNIDANAKTKKGVAAGYQTAILYLQPNDSLCPSSIEAGCREACLVSAGRAAIFEKIGIARKNKTNLFTNQNELFMALLFREIRAAIKKAVKKGLTPVFRLNGTSDIDWSRQKHDDKNVFEAFPDQIFYDYTKRTNLIRKSAEIKNWHMTASYSGASLRYAAKITKIANYYKVNLAVVFDKLPEIFLDQKVLNGDKSDLRFLDDSGIVGLVAKGAAKTDNSGFVYRTQNLIAIG